MIALASGPKAKVCRMPEFFLELFSEEIPARMQAGAAQELIRQTNLLIAQLGGTDTTTTFFGPRRIALGAEVAAATQAGKLEARGPRASAPEAALAGFLKKHGADLADIVVEDGYYLLRRALPPVSAGQLIETCCLPRYKDSPGQNPCAGVRAATSPGSGRYGVSSACSMEWSFPSNSAR